MRRTDSRRTASPARCGEREQRVGARERRGARVMHDHATGARGLAHRPLARHARQRVATGPAGGVERFEFDRRGSAQHAADDERVAPAAAARERPPGQIARLEEDDQRDARRTAAWRRAITISTAVEPSQRTVVRSPSTGRPPCIQRMSSRPLRTFQIVPAANQATTATAATPTSSVMADANDSTPVARGWRRALREFLYGMSGYEIAQQALEMRASMETLFMLGVFGDMLGVPILPPYYGLRLLPWVVPQIETWKRSVLRERELGSDHEHHLHGV